MPELYRVERPAGINEFREEAQEDPQIWQDSYDIKFQHGITKKVNGYEEGLGESKVDPSILVPLRDDNGLYYWWAYAGENTSPVPATATATQAGGIVDSITVTLAGDGYPIPPTVTITNSVGTGATAEAVMTDETVTSINILTGGTGYVDPVEILIDVPPSHRFYRITNTIDHLDVTPEVFYEPNLGIDYEWTGDTINGVPYLTYGVPYYYDNNLGKFTMFENIPRHSIGVEGEVGFDPSGGEPRVRFQVIRSYRNFLVGMNFDTDEYTGYFDADPAIDPAQWWGAWEEGVHQNAVWWSHSIVGKEVDEIWEDANSIKSSGWNFLGGTGGNVVDGRTLRDSFIIYRERSVWQMGFVGGVQIFAFKEIFNDVGCLGLDCTLEIDGEHLVVGQSDVYRHNGVRKTTIADGIVRKELFDRIHPDYTANVFIAGDYNAKEAWICIPTADQDIIIEEDGLVLEDFQGSCNLAYVYNWNENTWSKKRIPYLTGAIFTLLSISDLDVSWNAPSEGGPVDIEGTGIVVPGGSWAEAVDNWSDSFFKYNPAKWGVATTSKSTKIYTSIDQPLRGGNDDNIGSSFIAKVEKTYMDMGERLITKHISRLYPLVRKGVVDVYMAESMSLEEGINWKLIGRFDPALDEHISCRVTGRYIHVRFEIPEESVAEIRGYWVEFDFIGRR